MVAAISWPPLPFPQNILLGFTVTPADPTIRTEMDAAIDQVRQKYTGVPKAVTNAQLCLFMLDEKTLNQFYALAAGARFNWVDPNDMSSVECRFLSPPSFNRITPSHSMATFAFEILP